MVERSTERVGVGDLTAWKAAGRRVVMVTAYDYITARLCDEAGIDLLLVGDTLGMVVLGYDGTVAVTLEDIIHHTRAVARGARRAHVVGDLPFLSYHVSDEQAILSAGRLLKEGGAGSVKLEGGGGLIERLRAIVRAGIPAMGHIGLTPQTAAGYGGFRVRGRQADEAMALVEDALALEEAGAYALVLESVPRRVAEIITERLRIPTIGIGAGPACDGQVLVTPDLLGLTLEAPPRFVKQYAQLGAEVRQALETYASEVRTGSFPGPEHSYLMRSEELERLHQKLAGDTSPADS